MDQANGRWLQGNIRLAAHLVCPCAPQFVHLENVILLQGAISWMSRRLALLFFRFYSCGFAELGCHVGFFPGEAGQVSAEVAAVRGLGKDWTSEF